MKLYTTRLSNTDQHTSQYSFRFQYICCTFWICSLRLGGFQRPDGLVRLAPMHVLEASKRHTRLQAEIVLCPQILDSQIVVGGRMADDHTNITLRIFGYIIVSH